ncbi:MAG: hypothetical protein U5K54_24160 [Cytophagales bacterium]|nr:hypothetical protein [Cytophagales bacterium]
MEILKKYILSALAILLFACTHSVNDSKQNWITLFNGEDLNDWIVKVHHHVAGSKLWGYISGRRRND